VGRQAVAYNEHIAKIAALPSFDILFYFCGALLVRKCVKAATTAIMPVSRHLESAVQN
jgi:hypothetical protein